MRLETGKDGDRRRTWFFGATEHSPQEGLPQLQSSIQKAENMLSFHANHSVKRIVKNLIENMEKFQDWDNPQYYNIDTLKLLKSRKQELRDLAEVA